MRLRFHCISVNCKGPSSSQTDASENFTLQTEVFTSPHKPINPSTWSYANHPSSSLQAVQGLRSETGLESKLACRNFGLPCLEYKYNGCLLCHLQDRAGKTSTTLLSAETDLLSLQGEDFLERRKGKLGF